jgi:23S rRNA pseudouridine1911/1915/1917 synthase
MPGHRVTAKTAITKSGISTLDFSFTQADDTASLDKDKVPDAAGAGAKSPSVRDLFPILHEDAELLVINKPAGLVCHPTKGDEYSSLISRVRLYLGPELEHHLINRLDRETSGVVIVAKTADAARELRRLWEDRKVTKTYLAIVHGVPGQNEGLIEAALGKDHGSIIAIKDCVVASGAVAATQFQLLESFQTGRGSFSLLRVSPLQGRKHQIRIHLAHIGHPIVGDKLYGGDENLYLAFVKNLLTSADKERLMLPNHALHAAEVAWSWRDQKITFQASCDDAFRMFLPSSLAIRWIPSLPVNQV